MILISKEDDIDRYSRMKILNNKHPISSKRAHYGSN
jgi:hypothetical protein